MKKMPRIRGLSILAAGLLAATATAGIAYSQSVDSVTREAAQGAAEGAASQRRIDQIDQQTAEIVAEYKAVLQQVDTLKSYTRQLDRMITSQMREMERINQDIADVTEVERGIYPYMDQLVEDLAEFVRLDIPFQLNERQSRVERLRALLDRADASPAEKLRRILEAYQIENDYGRTVETWQDQITLDGEPTTVTMLRIGRVGYYFQTLDGERSGLWDGAAGQWHALPGSDNGPLLNAIRMARKQVPPDLMILPVKMPGGAQ